MIRALIFDFDGTILDTEVPDFDCWKAIYDSHGCTLSLEDWSKCLGTTYDVFNPFDHLEKLSGRTVDRLRVEEEHRQQFLTRVEAQPLAPGVTEWIAEALRLELRLGVASSSLREWVVGHLTRHNLYPHFHTVCCRDDGHRVKPHPDLYLAALDALGVQPHEALAVEDSPNGARAAKAAGIYTIAVPNLVSCTLPLDHADLRLESLASISLGEIISRVEENPRPKP